MRTSFDTRRNLRGIGSGREGVAGRPSARVAREHDTKHTAWQCQARERREVHGARDLGRSENPYIRESQKHATSISNPLLEACGLRAILRISTMPTAWFDRL